MGLFDRIKGPVFLKDDNDATRQLEELQALRGSVSADQADQLDRDIALVQAGIYGEQAVRFELENSHIPMFVLHDLYLEDEGLNAQIDYLIVTHKHNFVIECKNLYGNIEINSKGDFIRTMTFGRHTVKEGIYSPITQNRRHLDLIKQMRSKVQGNVVTKYLFEKWFDNNYKSIVVLSNPKTVLNDRYAKKADRGQVIRADQLAKFIRNIDSDKEDAKYSEKAMEDLARYFLDHHKTVREDYAKKYKGQEVVQEVADEPANEQANPDMICPRCGGNLILREAKRGDMKGNKFYGCSNYPKCRYIKNLE